MTKPNLSAPFGAANRQRLINEYFETHKAHSFGAAWRDVYALLLWIDRTTGLAHCYESDKCQPGKPWYARSLAFHSWLSRQLEVGPISVADRIDYLFKRATAELLSVYEAQQQKLRKKVEAQLALYPGIEFPLPGQDPELKDLMSELFRPFAGSLPDESSWTEIVQQVREHIATENKRKNLVGEGFEDVLAHVVRERLGPGSSATVRARMPVNEVPGFANSVVGDKDNRVDLVLVSSDAKLRILVTAKWSIRADRERQFSNEFSQYVSARSDQRPFRYVLVTNEFDPARLVRSCEQVAMNARMFDQVVHIAPDALLEVYGETKSRSQQRNLSLTMPQHANSTADEGTSSMEKVRAFIKSGRLIGLDSWLELLSNELK